MTATPERWLPIPDWEGLYEVSGHGHVRSLPRQNNGLRGGRILKPTLGSHGYLTVSLCGDGKEKRYLVHRLVLLAFVGPAGPDQETRHLDGDRTNNSLANLCWGTSSDNEWDKIRHGTHQKASLTQCANSHEWTEENTAFSYYPDGRVRQRVCKLCRKDYRLTSQQRREVNEQRCNDEDGCDEPVFAKGMCSKHYQRWYRTQPGNAEHMAARRRRWEERKRSEKVESLR